MATHKTTWLALAVAVHGYFVLALFVVAIILVYRGSLPESLDSLYNTFLTAGFFGPPILLLVCQNAIDVATRREEVIPAYAIRSRNLALLMSGLILLLILLGFALFVYVGFGNSIF